MVGQPPSWPWDPEECKIYVLLWTTRADLPTLDELMSMIEDKYGSPANGESEQKIYYAIFSPMALIEDRVSSEHNVPLAPYYDG